MQKSVTDTTLILPVIQSDTIYGAENVTYRQEYDIQHKTLGVIYAEGAFSEGTTSFSERDAAAIQTRLIGRVMGVLAAQQWQWLIREGLQDYAAAEIGPWLNDWRAVQLQPLLWRFYHPKDEAQFYNVDFLAEDLVNGWPSYRARLLALMAVVPATPRWGYAELDGADVDLSCESVMADGYLWYDDLLDLVGSATGPTDTVTLDPGTYNIRAMASHGGVYSFITYPTAVTVPEPTP